MKQFCWLLMGFNLLAASLVQAKNINANDLNVPDVIYGIDSRKESRLYSDKKFVELRRAIAIRVQDYRLSTRESNPEITDFSKILLSDMAPDMCTSERFRNQYSLGNCTGFIVGEKTLVTAGHCMFSDADCESYKWVFNFEDTSEEIKTSDIYSCKKILEQEFEYSDKKIRDFAVIELDRPVKGVTPLKFRKFGRPLIGTELVVIGHPMGLPMKTADGAKVAFLNDKEKENPWLSIKLRSNYIEANLDTYGGNSGSPVFNKNTGKVEGILIQGYDDFEWNMNNECESSINLKDGLSNSYEKVMRINKIKSLK